MDTDSIVKTYTAKLILASENDRNSVLNAMEWQTKAFNECSEHCFGLPKRNIKALHSGFYRKFRIKYPEISSAIVVAAQRECLSSYRSVKSNRHSVKVPIKKSNLSLQLNRTMYSTKTDGKFSIISSGKRVYCEPLFYDKLREHYEKYEICDPKLFVRDGEIWIAIPFRIPKVPLSSDTSTLGVDLGMRNFAVTSDGVIFDDKNFKRKQRNLRFNKRKLQARNTRSAKRHLKKIRRKERNRNRDYIHRMVNDILRSSDSRFVALENLKGIKRSGKRRNHNAISQVPFHEFRRILDYKAPDYGKMVIVVDPAFTSQMDCRTGKRSGKRCGRRYYGHDNVILDADWNAAINIAKKTIEHPVSFGVPLDGTIRTFRAGTCQRANRDSAFSRSCKLPALAGSR